jgi:serine protease
VSHDLCEFKNILRDTDVADTGNYCGSPNAGSQWHGTHVAGIIGAAGTNNGEGIASIAWNIAVLPVRVIGSGGGATDDIADAIRWAAGLHVDGVPDNTTPADVINMSLGGRIVCDEDNVAVLMSAITDARNSGAVIVAAAGNGAYVNDDGEECTPAPGDDACKFKPEDIKGYEPAGCPGVISVAASDPTGHIAFYSNFGNVTIMAPGGDERMKAEFPDGNGKTARPLGVWSTVRDGYGSMMGTSQAAPHVSAAIALALTVHPEWRRNPDLIEQKLRDTAFKPKPGSCPEATPCGAGQLDAKALLTSP